MSAIPAAVDAEAGPPTTLPLAHFVVALAFLVTGVVVGAGTGRPIHLAQVHLLLAGWVCLTILGAMTQFVPVWTGTALHSRRLATVQLPLASIGFAGLALGFLAEMSLLVPVAGVLALVGVWTFVYNVGRTLPSDDWDVTTTLFAVALGFFVLVTLLGFVLALDRMFGLTPIVGIDGTGLLTAHATLAVFGAVLTTVIGALAQLVPMFTQAPARRLDETLQQAVTVAYPAGVLLLAGGRLVGSPRVAGTGALLVAAGLATVGFVLVHRLLRTSVSWTPILTRYAVVAASLLLWAPLAVAAWVTDPLAYGRLFGGVASGSLLLVGAVAFTVFGTLYHVVPFLVWVDRYSDRVGLEDVPMVGDLYDDRVARADGVLLVAALSLAMATDIGLVVDDMFAGVLGFLGVCLFTANVCSVVVVHGPVSVPAWVGSGAE